MKKVILLFIIFICVMNSYAQKLNLVTLDYPPYIYEENNEVKGLSVDVVREAFRRMDIAIDIQVLPWLRALKKVELGEADAIFTVYKTDERMLFLDYSKEVVMPQVVSFFVKKDSDIAYTGDFKSIVDYRIGVVRGVSYGPIFDAAATDGIFKKINTVETGEKNFNVLSADRVDIVVSNRFGAYHIINSINKKDMFKELLPEIQSIPSYIGFSKKRNLSNLRDDFDKAIIKMKEDGTYDEILNKYY